MQLSAPKTVAIILCDQDTLNMYESTFQGRGLNTICYLTNRQNRKSEPIIQFLEENSPNKVILDIPPPIEENLKVFQEVKSCPEVNCGIIAPTCDKYKSKYLAGIDAGNIVDQTDIESIVSFVCDQPRRSVERSP